MIFGRWYQNFDLKLKFLAVWYLISIVLKALHNSKFHSYRNYVNNMGVFLERIVTTWFNGWVYKIKKIVWATYQKNDEGEGVCVFGKDVICEYFFKTQELRHICMPAEVDPSPDGLGRLSWTFNLLFPTENPFMVWIAACADIGLS